MMKRLLQSLVLVFVLASCATTSTDRTAALPPPGRIAPVLDYIERTWATLTRSHEDLLAALPDEKVEHEEGAPWVLYISAREDAERVREELRTRLGELGLRQIEIWSLPADARFKVDQLHPHGLLYLPHPYVVPGGRFNEMYGWDSYFTLVGLLIDGEGELAKDMVDNFIYEIEMYGTILNANRSYYLTRSQPPFLTPMILGVYEITKDRAWLESTLPAIDSYYRFWTTEPHLAGDTGLSRYFDVGEGPAPESVAGERDEAGLTHYDRVREYYRTHDVQAYDESLYYDEARDELTPLFYKGDRTMRESGFDPSNRYGPFSVDIIHYAPADLNALLYRMETDAAAINRLLGRRDDAATWSKRAVERSEKMNRYLWDDSTGMYFDYSFRDGRRSTYEFASTFYPLWAGQASKAQAARVAANLYRFEAPGGLLTSTTISGSQWDAPFGWGPLQMIAVEALRRYGYDEDASRLAARWVSLVTKEFTEHKIIVEKYDVVQRESAVEAGIQFGYNSNEVGFGWTNASYLALLRGLD